METVKQEVNESQRPACHILSWFRRRTILESVTDLSPKPGNESIFGLMSNTNTIHYDNSESLRQMAYGLLLQTTR